MKRLKKPFAIVVIFAMLCTWISINISQAVEKPTIESFTLSKYEFDLNDSNLNLDIELVVSHNSGIFEKSTVFVLGKDTNFSISTVLNRIDDPLNASLQKVIFRGKLSIPREFPSGVYQYYATGVSSNILTNRGLVPTGEIAGPKLRSIFGAESGVILRSAGYLDLEFSILNGPIFGNQSGKTYLNPAKLYGIPEPIWRVGELIDIKKYYEVVANDVQLNVESKTPSVCVVNDQKLQLIAQGLCTYLIETIRNSNYKSQRIFDTNLVESARSIQELAIEEVPVQTPNSFPFRIQLNVVYASGISSVEVVFPKSDTEEICKVAGYIVTVFAGGNCILSYQSQGNNKFQPSSKYNQIIKIDKKLNKITFVLPKNINLSDGQIQLTAKGQGTNKLDFKSLTPEFCLESSNDEILQLKKAGLCKVEVRQSEDSYFLESSAIAAIEIYDLKKKSDRKSKKIQKKKRQ